MSLNVVILAAGQGKRMFSQLPKVLHCIGGRSLISHVTDTARALSASRICVVYGHGGDHVKEAMAAADLVFARQDPQLGTAHALQQALPHLDPDSPTLVLYGDVPLIRERTLRDLLQAQRTGVALLTAQLSDPKGYGRVVRDARGGVTRIVEERDASTAERAIREINTGIMALPTARLERWLACIGNDNAQREYYLTDLVALAVREGVSVSAVTVADVVETLGVNSKRQLAELERAYQLRRAGELLDQGVTLADPARIDVRGKLECESDVSIDVNCVFEGEVALAAGVVIGANCVISNTSIGAQTRIEPFSCIDGARVGERCRIGPYARIRPGTQLAEEVHVGNFVEVKASRIAAGSKANHLSYVGDTTVGRNVNIGAGTITCNYDGAYKHRTVIEDDVFIGSDTQLVAPVTVRRGATIGAGSTITREAPPDELTLSRAKQVSVSGWKRPAIAGERGSAQEGWRTRMCGIVGAVSTRNVVPVLLEGLRCLEYRGYDSAGVAVVNGSLQRLRSTGRVAELAKLAGERGLSGHIGIAHTRWATHGVPSERNAHPHISGGLSVVHNGIIENHEEMRRKLEARGYEFTSDTDTEVIAHLVHEKLNGGCALLDAVRLSANELTGAYAIAVIADSEPDRLVVARMGAPLLLGLGNGENFAASDTSALVQVTQRVIYLEEDDCAELTREHIQIIDRDGHIVERPVHVSELTAEAVQLGPYRHYMQKEIFEQPMAVANTLEMVTNAQAVSPRLFGSEAEAVFREADSVLILACGTSFHAGLVARYWVESLVGIPCNVEIASEYRYRDSVANPRTLIVTISQSGETADTLAALRHAKSIGHRHCLTICNVPESALVRQSELRFMTRAGPEIGVASTKAFTTQLAALVLLTMSLAKMRGRLAPEREAEVLQALRHLPAALTRVLNVETQIVDWSHRFAHRHHALFLGRGVHYPIAMEGALKLKEISYIHAEAYAAGELKHGPLALVDADMPVVAIAPKDALFEKLKSNLQEVRARGGELYVIADQDARLKDAKGVHVINMPDHAGILSPILHTVPLQLLAYHAAIERGNDVDKPRNLAKSVTVE